jgi:hypothetical protein
MYSQISSSDVHILAADELLGGLHQVKGPGIDRACWLRQTLKQQNRDQTHGQENDKDKCKPGDDRLLGFEYRFLPDHSASCGPIKRGWLE